MGIRILPVAVLLCTINLNTWATDSLDKSREIVATTNRELQASQQKINRADDKTAQMLSEYKTVLKELDNYQIYNGQLGEIVSSQEGEMRRISCDIDKIESTGLHILPFMQEMIDGLERFIASDYPFLPEERRQRIVHLNASMKRADVSTAAKFRQILEAYQIEIDYGNTLEAYEGHLEGRRVEFLKIGRIGFYYLSLDRKECGAWDAAQHRWQALDDIDYTIYIAKAIQIAKKQQAPDLIFAAVPPAKDRP
jgi:hypothetical protein